MDVNLTIGVSALTGVLLLNGVATTLKLIRSRNGNKPTAEAIISLKEGQKVMCENQTAMAETQRAMLSVVKELKDGQEKFRECFMDLITGAGKREVHLENMLTELRQLNNNRRV